MRSTGAFVGVANDKVNHLSREESEFSLRVVFRAVANLALTRSVRAARTDSYVKIRLLALPALAPLQPASTSVAIAARCRVF